MVITRVFFLPQEFCASVSPKLQPRVLLHRISSVEDMLGRMRTTDEVLRNTPPSSNSASSSEGNDREEDGQSDEVGMCYLKKKFFQTVMFPYLVY